MSKAQNLTAEALAGFAAASAEVDVGACPYYACSAAGMAWLVGAWCFRVGRSAPRNVAASRGCSIRADGELFKFGTRHDPAAIVSSRRIERFVLTKET